MVHRDIKPENVLLSGGTRLWQRGDTVDRQDRAGSAYRELSILWGKEFRVAMDYLATRRDLDSTRIGYYGQSMGARLMPVMATASPRIRAAVVNCPGIAVDRIVPEANVVHYLPRVQLPTLIVGGRLDTVFPYEEAQLPYQSLLGMPASARKVVTLPDAGHCPPFDSFLREALPWLDRWLGAVAR